MSIYLDYNASAPIDHRVLDYMVQLYKGVPGNPDSRTHNFGDNARKIVEEARQKIASLLSIDKTEVFFTSGATESNNIALMGLREYANISGKKHIITTSIEHKAILETAKKLQSDGFIVDFIKPDISGRVKFEDVKKLLRDDTLIVSVMHVNNETGIIQPVKEIGDYLNEKGILFHIDATQSFGKLVDELREMKYDMLSIGAHKIGGPQGIGALILKKKRYKLPPVKSIMYGGEQEHGLRPGTLPVALIGAFGKACEVAQAEYKENHEKCLRIKEVIMKLLDESGVNYHINGNQIYGVANTLNICFFGVSSEALMLSTKQYCGVSNGSACNTHSYKPSFVLTSMGVPLDEIECSIRVSWGPETNVNDLKLSFVNLLGVAISLA